MQDREKNLGHDWIKPRAIHDPADRTGRRECMRLVRGGRGPGLGFGRMGLTGLGKHMAGFRFRS